jgi:TM2 domain-containing membrane protein YozV
VTEQNGGPEPAPQEPQQPRYGTPPQQPYQPYQAPYQAPAPGYPVAPGGYPAPFPGVKIPGQIDPETGLQFSDKERLTTGLIQLIPSLLGFPGIGRLYTGHVALGLIQLIGAMASYVLICLIIGIFTLPAFIIWGIVDGIIMLTNKRFVDAQGRVLR